MTLSLTRRTRRAYVVVEVTGRWRFRDGASYRDAIVRLPDGRLERRAIREDLLELAA